MSALSKEKLRAVRVAMDAALAIIAKEQGLTALKCGKCTYSPDGSFTMKVEGIAAGGLSKEASTYNDLRTFTPGLPELGTEVDFITRKGTVLGSNTTGSKVLVKDSKSGVTYLFRTSDVVRAAARTVVLP